MNPFWLIPIILFSAFLGVGLMAWVSARATDDFHAAIARRDEVIDDLCTGFGLRELYGCEEPRPGGMQIHFADGTVWAVSNDNLAGWTRVV